MISKNSKRLIKKIVVIVLSITILFWLFTFIFYYRLKPNTYKRKKYNYEKGSLIYDPINKISKVDKNKINDYTLVEANPKNNNTELKIDLKTTNLIINKDGKTFETMPYSTLGTSIKKPQKSPFRISYNYKGEANTTDLLAYNGSIEGGNYKVYKIKNGVRIIYDCAQRNVEKSWIPTLIKSLEYEEIIKSEKLAGEQFKLFKRLYNKKRNTDYHELLNLATRENLSDLYDIWVSKLNLTDDDLNKRMIEATGKPVYVKKPHFIIPIDFVITKDGQLKVTILLDKIKELSPDRGELTLHIKKISLLENMMIVKDEKKDNEDFIFIPDGSGALIKTSNKKEETKVNYIKPIYDNNKYISKTNKKIDFGEKILLPLYGVGIKDKGILSIIEEGFGVATLNSKYDSGYSYTYPEFNLRIDDTYEFVKGVPITSYGEIEKNFNISCNYSFVSNNLNKPVTYFDFIKTIQKLYFNNHKKIDNKNLILLDILGAFITKEHILGIPYYKTRALTKYKDVNEILNFYKDYNINYKYSGFSKGGLNGKSQIKIKHDKELGDLKTFNSLLDKDIYFDIYIATRYFDKDDRFKNSRTGLQSVGGNRKSYSNRNPMTLEYLDYDLTKYYILNPNFLEEEINKFNLNNSKFNNLSFRDLGNTFYANYTNKPLDYDYCNELINRNFINIKKNKKIMLNQAFFHSALFADIIEDLPSNSSNHDSFYQDIPFIQLLYSPYINIYGNSINLNDNEINYNSNKKYLNYALMSNQGLKYILTKTSSNLTKQTPYYNKYYQTHIDLYKEDIDNNYNILNEFRSKNKQIINHELIFKDIFRVTFNDDNVYIFNMSNSSYDYDNNGKTITIKANSKLKIK